MHENAKESNLTLNYRGITFITSTCFTNIAYFRVDFYFGKFNFRHFSTLKLNCLPNPVQGDDKFEEENYEYFVDLDFFIFKNWFFKVFSKFKLKLKKGLKE